MMHRGLAMGGGLAGLSGVLYASAFPPLGLWPLGWVCLVPLMLAARNRPLAQVALLGGVAGWTYAVLTGWWVWVAAHYQFHQSWLVSTLFVAVAIGLGCGVAQLIAAPVAEAAARNARIPIPRVVAWPLAWALGEWVRTTGPIALPWCLLGATQAPVPLHLQVADLGGAVFLSAVLALVNACIAEALANPAWRRRALATAAVTYALVAAYGTVHLLLAPSSGVQEEADVALIQGNIPQQERWERERWPKHYDVHRTLTLRSRAAMPEVILWPETAWGARSVDNPAVFADPLRNLVLPGQVLIGGFQEVASGASPEGMARHYNAAISVQRTGIPTVYRKRRLVPFAEYLPLGRLSDVLGVRSRFGHDLRPGSQAPNMLNFHDHRFVGALICFEFLYPEPLVNSVRAGARWFAVLSNDAWYDTTPAPAQHHAQLALASVATRRWAVRATNTGLSGGFDPWGRPLPIRMGEIVRPGEPGTSEVKAEGLPVFELTTLPARETAWGIVRLDRRTHFTPFVRLGNWPAWGAAIFWFSFAVLVLIARRRVPAVEAPSPQQASA